MEILPEGMVFPYIGRVHHACHVAVPAVDAVAVCLEADGVQVSFRGGPEGPVSLIRQVAEFRGFCGMATWVVPIVFLAVRFSFHRLTALCAILLKSIVAVFRGCFLPANIRREKAFVKPFTITPLITRWFTFVNWNLYAVYHFPVKSR